MFRLWVALAFTTKGYVLNILWFSWKDIEHPESGGAEIVTHELLKHASDDGHDVVLISSCFPRGASFVKKDGYKIWRVGNRWTVYLKAWRLYKEKYLGWPDIVIDECNTIPFFTRFYIKESRRMFFHQLCREIWFYQMIWPLSWLGFVIEPLYLWILRKEIVITVSNSTKNDLCRFGFTTENINIISEGIEIEPINSLESVKKDDVPTMLILGAIRPMKRTLDMISAFELTKKDIPTLKLIIAGSGNGEYMDKVTKKIEYSYYKKDISYLGRVSLEVKKEIMGKAHVLAVASVKEGWGLVVTEANSQGTPCVVYDVDGLRDSVMDGETGYICECNTPSNMARKIRMLLEFKSDYEIIRRNAWEMSKQITFSKSYNDFKRLILTNK